MTMIKKQNNFIICSVVIIGLLFEWANKSWLMPNTNYVEFYTVSSGARAVLLIISTLAIYKVKGSILLCALMFFNLFAIFLNILYVGSTENYYLLHEFRQSYFVNCYRALELLILLWTGRDALSHLSHIVGVIRHRLSFVVARRRIYAKAKS